MLYQWYELGRAVVEPARAAADANGLLFTNPFNLLTHTDAGRQAAAACEVFERSTRHYPKPEFRIDSVRIDGTTATVHEKVVWQKPFCRLVHFQRDICPERAAGDPRLLIIAPMSGHFATLLRGTVEALLPNHDVYITDWADARDVPLDQGRFDLDDYIDYVREMLRWFGGDVHVFAVCQSAVPALAAVALMEEDADPAAPHSLVLAGGPIDTRKSPTAVNDLARERGADWFVNSVITQAPWPSAGHGRSVYPGFLQLSGFMAMNLGRHVNAHHEFFGHLVAGDGGSAEKHRAFYDEYLAVMDLTAEFFLQTLDTVFVRHALPRGEMHHRGRSVDPSSICRVALMTVEGDKDDITGLGQCAAAHDITPNVAPLMREHVVAEGVGHFGIFNGSRFRHLIAPQIGRFVRRHDPGHEEPVLMAELDPETARALARGEASRLDDLAFTFRVANDAAADPTDSRLKRHGLGIVAAPQAVDPPTSASACLPLLDAAVWPLQAWAAGIHYLTTGHLPGEIDQT